jgi:Lrp/AsnC family transcriptional regulator
MSGEYDDMLKVLVADMKAFDVFYKRLLGGIELSDVTSSFAMEQIKYTTALPV